MDWFGLTAQAELEAIQAQLEKVKRELESSKNLIDSINKTMRDASFAFDFEKMNAFSIERMAKDNLPCTVIGYPLPKVEVKDGVETTSTSINEWYLYCSDKQHEKLVKEFEEYRKKGVQPTENVV
jgi:DNA repair exonuclease SbcCD ATPase subunit